MLKHTTSIHSELGSNSYICNYIIKYIIHKNHKISLNLINIFINTYKNINVLKIQHLKLHEIIVDKLIDIF